MTRTAALIVALSVISGGASPASAHRLQTSSGHYTVNVAAGTVDGVLRLDVTMLPPVAGHTPPEDPSVRPLWRPTVAAEIGRAFGSRIALRVDGRRCTAVTLGLAGERDEDMVALTLRWRCSRPLRGELVIRFDFIPVIAADHVHVVRFGDATPVMLTVEDATFRAPIARLAAATGDTLATPTANGSDDPRQLTFARIVWEGALHIGTGWDHLLFLLALLLGVASTRQAVAVVTAFTVAHSVTLALAVLDVVTLPERPVEAVIAASIVVVALSHGPTSGRRGGWGPVLWAFGFGLIHGLGFAGYLKGIDIFADGIAVPLIAFNLGIEAAQLTLVAVVLPGLLWASRRPWWPRARLALVAATATVGGYWLIERLIG